MNEARCVDKEMIKAGMFEKDKWYKVEKRKKFLGKQMIAFSHLAAWFSVSDFDQRWNYNHEHIKGSEVRV